jgi:hypothetical protein
MTGLRKWGAVNFAQIDEYRLALFRDVEAARPRAAIQNAASVAALLITTEAMVAELPKKNAAGGGNSLQCMDSKKWRKPSTSDHNR